MEGPYTFHQHGLSPPMLITRKTKKPNLLNEPNTSDDMSTIFCTKPTLSTSNNTINIFFSTSFRLVTRYGCTCKNRNSHVFMGILNYDDTSLALSPRSWVRMVLNLNLPPFIGLHPIFNLELPQLYFRPLLGTSKMIGHLVTIYGNPNYIKQAIVD